jgi:hypothetical protein
MERETKLNSKVVATMLNKAIAVDNEFIRSNDRQATIVLTKLSLNIMLIEIRSSAARKTFV